MFHLVTTGDGPSPVVTRWNPWFKAVTYISENFDFILNFVNDECEIDDTIALKKLKNLFQISNIKKQFEYLNSKCNKFKYSLLKFEDQQLKSTEVYSIIFDLFNWLVGNLESEENEETFEVEFTRKLFTAAKAKLKKYIIDGAHPAIELFSCDSERALSKYKNVLDDKRQNMT